MGTPCTGKLAWSHLLWPCPFALPPKLAKDLAQSHTHHQRSKPPLCRVPHSSIPGQISCPCPMAENSCLLNQTWCFLLKCTPNAHIKFEQSYSLVGIVSPLSPVTYLQSSWSAGQECLASAQGSVIPILLVKKPRILEALHPSTASTSTNLNPATDRNKSRWFPPPPTRIGARETSEVPYLSKAPEPRCICPGPGR